METEAPAHEQGFCCGLGRRRDPAISTQQRALCADCNVRSRSRAAAKAAAASSGRASNPVSTNPTLALATAHRAQWARCSTSTTALQSPERQSGPESSSGAAPCISAEGRRAGAGSNRAEGLRPHSAPPRAQVRGRACRKQQQIAPAAIVRRPEARPSEQWFRGRAGRRSSPPADHFEDASLPLGLEAACQRPAAASADQLVRSGKWRQRQASRQHPGRAKSRQAAGRPASRTTHQTLCNRPI